MTKLPKWLNKLIHGQEDPENPSDNNYEDKFRIKAIQLKSNLTKYFPEYKLGMMSSWQTIICINNKGVTTLFLDNNDLISSTLHHCDTTDEARDLINQYKELLVKERELEFKKEEIIKI